MNEPLGEHGGEVLRRLTLFGTDRQRGDLLTAEELGELPIRHKTALRNAGLVRYFDKPVIEGEAVKEKSVKKKSVKKKSVKKSSRRKT